MIIASTYSQDNVRGADATVNVLSSPISQTVRYSTHPSVRQTGSQLVSR